MPGTKSIAVRLVRVNEHDWFTLQIDPEWRQEDSYRYNLLNGLSMGPDYRYAETALRDWNEERARSGLNQFHIVDEFGG